MKVSFPLSLKITVWMLLNLLLLSVAVVTFFVAHVVYGAIVGAGYGHVPAERQWAPTGRL